MAIIEPIHALIIASEVTKGMKSIGSKSLLRIKNSVLVIEHQIQELKKQHKNIDITVATGFESEKMLKILDEHNVKFLHNPKYQTTNQTKSIIDYIGSHIPNKLLIISSGILFKNRFSMSGHDSCMFMLDKPKADFTIGCDMKDDSIYLFYDLPQKWSECSMLNSKDLNVLKKISKDKNLDQLYLFEVMNLLSDNGSKINKINISKQQIMKITNIKDLSKARSFV
jgi:CTP:phosphocholine cytidylyltransferase-like protein